MTTQERINFANAVAARRPTSIASAMNTSLTQPYLCLPPDLRINNGEAQLFFRGDRRPPSQIFPTGFQPEVVTSLTSVCLTRDLAVAVSFPPLAPVQPAPVVDYLYFIAINDYYDTHQLQANIAFSRAQLQLLMSRERNSKCAHYKS
jgi:hypothetical protein